MQAPGGSGREADIGAARGLRGQAGQVLRGKSLDLEAGTAARDHAVDCGRERHLAAEQSRPCHVT